MDNKEEILDALDEFSRKPTEEVPPLLEEYLARIAATGETVFPWNKLRPLFIHKLEAVMAEFFEQVPTDELPLCPNVENVKFQEMRERLIVSINSFNGAPFTIQRLCELLTNPKKHYKRTDKFMRGIEKNVMVVSTVDPHGNKIVSEPKMLVNGMDANGYEEGKEAAGDSSLMDSPFLPPAPPTASPNTSLTASPLGTPWYHNITAAASSPDASTSTNGVMASGASLWGLGSSNMADSSMEARPGTSSPDLEEEVTQSSSQEMDTDSEKNKEDLVESSESESTVNKTETMPSENMDTSESGEVSTSDKEIGGDQDGPSTENQSEGIQTEDRSQLLSDGNSSAAESSLSSSSSSSSSSSTGALPTVETDMQELPEPDTSSTPEARNDCDPLSRGDTAEQNVEGSAGDVATSSSEALEGGSHDSESQAVPADISERQDSGGFDTSRLITDSKDSDESHTTSEAQEKPTTSEPLTTNNLPSDPLTTTSLPSEPPTPDNPLSEPPPKENNTSEAVTSSQNGNSSSHLEEEEEIPEKKRKIEEKNIEIPDLETGVNKVEESLPVVEDESKSHTTTENQSVSSSDNIISEKSAGEVCGEADSAGSKECLRFGGDSEASSVQSDSATPTKTLGSLQPQSTPDSTPNNESAEEESVQDTSSDQTLAPPDESTKVLSSEQTELTSPQETPQKQNEVPSSGSQEEPMDTA